MKTLRLILFSFLLLSQQALSSQSPAFQSFPEFDISISPNVPQVCPGTSTNVICNEDFLEYKWKGVGFKFKASGKKVELAQVGQYTLTIKSKIEGVPYYKILNFYTESSDSDGDVVCDSEDCAPMNPFAAEGIACDDRNPCTENDAFDSKCICVGSRISDCDSPITDQASINKSELKEQLISTFLTALKKDFKSTSNLEDFVGKLSEIPYTQNLLNGEIVSVINKLPSSEIKKLFTDIQNSQFSQGYLGHQLESISANNIIAWQGISESPKKFRTRTSIQDSVYSYMTDFDKSAMDVAKEISMAKKGHLWWYKFVLGRKYWSPFLEDIDNIKAFASEIISFNRETEGGGRTLSGTPSSAINTALYYEDVLEQGASIFKTIIKNHMFYDGNKRTAMNTIKSFMNKAGIPIKRSDKKIFKLAKKVAKDEITEVSEIANELIK